MEICGYIESSFVVDNICECDSDVECECESYEEIKYKWIEFVVDEITLRNDFLYIAIPCHDIHHKLSDIKHQYFTSAYEISYELFLKHRTSSSEFEMVKRKLSRGDVFKFVYK